MSLRNLKKLHGTKDLPKPDDSSGDEYEPLYAKLDKNLFINIPLSSHSGTGEEGSTDCNEPDSPEKKKKEKKKKRKNKKERRRARSTLENVEGMDEIDKSVMEVNALLGTPPPAEPKVEEEPKEDIRQVEVKHLNVALELKRFFGSDDEAERPRNRGRVPNLRRIQKQVIIEDNTIPAIGGLSMTLLDRKDGCAYFTFTHSRSYQEKHINFLKATDHRIVDPLFSLFGDTYKHVEAQLEISDFFFLKEEYTIANTLVEKVILKMQAAFHPSFRLGDLNTRLEYKYIENRPFHVAILKYIHLLSNRACHRTALELAKMLMNLDPLDPLALIFIIDVLAIRAREFEWLIKAIDFWRQERGAELMFNMRYSYALANFHMARKGKGDMSKATQLLQDAILTFPKVGLHLMELANASDAKRIADHDLFSLPVRDLALTKKLRELYLVFAHFATGRWREQEPAQWLVKTMLDTIALYDSSPETQEKANELREVTFSLLRVVPTEILRHLAVITPMSNLLVDGAVPEVPTTRLTDPLPVVADTIDRPGYMKYSTNYRFHHNQYAPDYMFLGDVLMPDYLSATIYSLIGNYEPESDGSTNTYTYTDSDFDFD